MINKRINYKGHKASTIINQYLRAQCTIGTQEFQGKLLLYLPNLPTKSSQYREKVTTKSHVP